MSSVPATPETVRDLIEHQAAANPLGVYALDAEGAQELRFGELAQHCRTVALQLMAHGLQPGDTVSLVMPNGLGTLRWLLGALHGGWCVNPVNLLSSPAQMHYVLEHSDCKLIIASPEWADAVRTALATIARPVELIVCAADELSPVLANAITGTADAATHATPDQLALLMYTSGTTGVPKGVMLTQANLAANARSISTEHGLSERDRVLAVLPLYHINAFAVTMLAPLAHGGSLVMPPRFSASTFWQHALAWRCTWLNVVPTMISYVLEGPAPSPEAERTIRFCRSASAPLAPAHLQAFEAKFGIPIIETMGLTETAAPAFSNPMEAGLRKLGSVGRASGCEARVIDANLQSVADGTTGEIAIRGPQVMRGYYKNETATHDSFTPNGWLRTGDLGHRDSDGFFFVTGRIKELIIKGGENIAPREIDEVLLQHPIVQDAAAVGMADAHYGQDILVCIVLRDGFAADEQAIRSFCLTHLGRYKTPKQIRFVATLPRGPSGKVQRLKLLDLP